MISGRRSAWAAGILAPPSTFTQLRCKRVDIGVESLFSGLKSLPSLVIDQPGLAALRRQPQVGVVGAQEQPIFGSRREHSIRLEAALRDQVVDHDAEIGLVAAEDQRLAPLDRERRVEAGNSPWPAASSYPDVPLI